MTRIGGVAGLLAAVLLSSACGSVGSAGAPPIRIGAIFPLTGSTAPLANDELLGVRVAQEMVNAGGGVDGRQISLDLRDVDTTAGAQRAADSLRDDGVPAVIGAYSSALSIAASAAVAADGMVYWESGAVADQLTGRGLPLVFRVGANGSDLGGNSGRFLVQQIAPRLHLSASALRIFLVTADDAYGHSVSDAARAALTSSGVAMLAEAAYNPYLPNWTPVIGSIAAMRPDAVILTSHIPDGIAFRRAFLAAGLHAGAFIGSTMAQCPPDFGDALGQQAVGVFASDRPDDSINPAVLNPQTRVLYDRFAAAWRGNTGRQPSEEGIAGFSAAWALFHDVLPHASGLNPGALAAAARGLDLPAGSLPDGAGVLFASQASLLGQNLRAAADIEQWQSAGHAVAVWPEAYATGTINMRLAPA